MSHEFDAKLPLGYDPPTSVRPEITSLAEFAAAALRDVINQITSGGEAADPATGLVHIVVFEATLFAEALEMVIVAHATGRHRAAFALQRSMFEYVTRARSYAREYSTGTDRWTNILHRIAEDERLAGGGRRLERVEAQYQAWKEAGQITRLLDESFEKILTREYSAADEDATRFLYQHYRRPAIFAHGGLGAIDDVFMPGEAGNVYSINSLTVDGDAQLLSSCMLCCELILFVGTICDIDVGATTRRIMEIFEGLKSSHNKRREVGI